MPQETEKKIPSLKTQSAWLLFAKVVGFALSFLLPLLTVRYLNQEQVGVYRQVFLSVVNANSIFALGFGMSAYYFLARETARRSSVVINILLFNFTVGGLVCLTLFLYPSLLGGIFQSREITGFAPKIGIIIWLWLVSNFLEIVAVANREPRMATAFIIAAQFTKTALMSLAVIVFSTVEAFVYAAIIQGAIQTIVLLVYLNSRFPRFWTAFDLKFFREQLFYALPFGIIALMWTMQTDIHNYFVSYHFGSAEFAVYAIGCFELPLIGLIAEAVTSVLIPRMSELQANDDKKEILRLMFRAGQKLAFFYFPLYVFLMITAETFITTLFTGTYSESVPIFLINLTLLPVYVWVTDPIIRAYKELGRFLLILRVFLLIALLGALYFGIQNFDLRGMIAIVIASAIIEKTISTVVVLRKLGAKKDDLRMLKATFKTGAASLLAGVLTLLFYWNFGDAIFVRAENFIQTMFAQAKITIVDFIAGGLVLGLSALIFAPVYLFAADRFGVLEAADKEKVFSTFKKILRRPSARIEERLAEERLETNF